MYTNCHMSGAPKQFDKQKVLSKALEQFWACGYEATSMQDLVNAMGINRASMYTTFGNKQELFNQVFDVYCEMSLTNIESVLQATDSEIYNIKQFLSLLTGADESRINHGCFVNNAAVELGPHDANIAKKARDFWEQIRAYLQQALVRAIEKKELQADINTHSLAGLLNVVLQGLSAMRKAGIGADPSRDAVQQFLSLLPTK